MDGILDKKRLRASLTDVFAGIICSVLSIAYCLSYAALIFAGPLQHYLAYGIAVTFLSAAIGGAVVASRSSLPFAVGGPDSSTSVVVAALVTTITARVIANGGSDVIQPAIIGMSLATALTGVLLCFLGFTHAGRAIRFLPYPVIGGFLGATGWLMVTGAISVITQQRPTLTNLGSFANLDVAYKVAAAIVVAIALRFVLGRFKSSFGMPAVLLAALAITHLVLPLIGVSLAHAQANDWMFQPQPVASLTLPWKASALHSFPWPALPSLAGDVIAVAFVAICALLLNTTGIEIATRNEANIERDLKVHGLANLLSAAFGGYVSCTSLSRSILVRNAGATGRLAGLTVAAISAVLLFVGPSFLGYVPRYILGGLLFYLGADLVERWLVSPAWRLLLVEYFSLIAIAGLIIYSGFIAGILIGVVIGCATFALSASRVNAIKFNFDGSEYRSSLDRGPRELALLTDYGSEIQGMTLQSYLFFGSANRLYQYVKALLAERPDCRFLIFDLRLVTGIDSSATHSFSQIKQAAANYGTEIVLVNLSPELQRAFSTAGFISDNVTVASDLDRALETCEEKVIEMYLAEDGDARSLRSWLSEALGSMENADRLAEYCRRLEVAPGDIIAQQGDVASSMHFILEGRVGINVAVGDGRAMRVRSLGRHTTIGEMGLITRRPRSATIRAEAASVLYELSADAYDQIRSEEPALGEALLSYIIAVMAERLSFANRAIGVLQR